MSQYVIDYAIVDNDGRILMFGKSLTRPTREGFQTLDTAPPDINHYWSGFGWVAIPTSPSPEHIFDYTTKQWVDLRTLDTLQEEACVRIQKWRDAQEAATFIFEHAGREWDGGLVTRQRLQPVVSLSQLPDGFFWTDADNVDVPMDMQSLQLLAAAHEQALVVRGFQIHARQRAMKESLGTMTRQQLLDFYPGWEDPVLIPEQPKDS